MPNVPTDANATPNYTAAQHADFHNTLSATQNSTKAASRIAARANFR